MRQLELPLRAPRLPHPSVGLLLYRWRMENGLTVKHLADHFECSKAFVTMVENSSKPMPADWLPSLPNHIQEAWELEHKARLTINHWNRTRGRRLRGKEKHYEYKRAR